MSSQEIELPDGRKITTRRHAPTSQVKRLDELETNDLLKLIFIAQQDVVAKLDAAVPRGETLPLTLSVTTTPIMVNQYYTLPSGNDFDPPYRRMDLFNDGPRPVYFHVNDQFNRGLEASLNVHDMYVDDYVELKLRNLVLFEAPGEQTPTQVRVFFKR